MNARTLALLLALVIAAAGCRAPAPREPAYPGQYMSLLAEFNSINQQIEAKAKPVRAKSKEAQLKELAGMIRQDAALFGKLLARATGIEPEERYTALHAALLDYVGDLESSLRNLAEMAESGDEARLAALQDGSMERRLAGKLKTLVAEQQAVGIVAKVPGLP